MPTSSAYFEFDVTLLHCEPSVWRRFLLRASCDFHELHDTIQRACGWRDSHLHAFRSIDEGSHIAMCAYDEQFEPGPWPLATQVRLRDHFFAPGDAVLYEYDYGDGWQHRVELRAQERRAGSRRRSIVDGARAFPPEDCGGIPGYEDCVAAHRATAADIETMDPEAQGELLSLRKWMGNWHPERFDRDEIERAMRKPVQYPQYRERDR